MRPRQERRVAHVALLRIALILAAEGKWTTECLDLWQVAMEFTKHRPWWRFW